MPVRSNTQIETEIGMVPLPGTQQIRFSTEGGLLTRRKNSTGGPLAEGTAVKMDPANDESIIPTVAGGVECIGCVYEDIPDGEYGWITIIGVGHVLVEAPGCSRGDWLGTSNVTPGVAQAQASTPAGVALRFQQIGHAREDLVGAGLVSALIRTN